MKQKKGMKSWNNKNQRNKYVNQNVGYTCGEHHGCGRMQVPCKVDTSRSGLKRTIAN
jgi:hypothetical protein